MYPYATSRDHTDVEDQVDWKVIEKKDHEPVLVLDYKPSVQNTKLFYNSWWSKGDEVIPPLKKR